MYIYIYKIYIWLYIWLYIYMIIYIHMIIYIWLYIYTYNYIELKSCGFHNFCAKPRVDSTSTAIPSMSICAYLHVQPWPSIYKSRAVVSSYPIIDSCRDKGETFLHLVEALKYTGMWFNLYMPYQHEQWPSRILFKICSRFIIFMSPTVVCISVKIVDYTQILVGSLPTSRGLPTCCSCIARGPWKNLEDVGLGQIWGFGSPNWGDQGRDLAKGCHCLVATPGAQTTKDTKRHRQMLV